MVMKCTFAAIGAVTNRTIKESLEFPPTREIADACFTEALAVAKAMGYDLGEDYLTQALGYLEKVGVHKDSMCHDIENKTPTENDFLGAKIVDYARAKGFQDYSMTYATPLPGEVMWFSSLIASNRPGPFAAAHTSPPSSPRAIWPRRR